MGCYCCVKGCNSGRKFDKGNGYTFHRFPLDKERHKMWVAQLQRECPNFFPKKWSRICSKHFEEECFEKNFCLNKVVLSKNAIPTIFNVRNSPKQQRFLTLSVPEDQVEVDKISLTPSIRHLEGEELVSAPIQELEINNDDLIIPDVITPVTPSIEKVIVKREIDWSSSDSNPSQEQIFAATSNFENQCIKMEDISLTSNDYNVPEKQTFDATYVLENPSVKMEEVSLTSSDNNLPEEQTFDATSVFKDNGGNEPFSRCMDSYSSTSDSNESDNSNVSPDGDELPENINSIKSEVKTNKSYQETAKGLGNSDQHFVTKSYKYVPTKKFSDISCNCRHSCNQHFSEEDRKNMFDNFWRISDSKRQNAVICSLIQKVEGKRRRPRKDNAQLKESTVKYLLKSENGVTEQVCKKYFLNTFCISNERVASALKEISEGKVSGEDLSGCSTRNILSCTVQLVIHHINSFPSYESHCTRRNNAKVPKYLSDSLNIVKMYELYEEMCNSCGKTSVKQHYYRYVFKTYFNLRFYKPKKDTCKTCDIFHRKYCNKKLNDSENANLKADYDIHLQNAKLATDSMIKDAEYAKKDSGIYVCSVGLQKALPFPLLTVSDAYYKRSCYCYNFGVHDLDKDIGFFYVWDETVASTGSQDLASCLVKHIKLKASTKKKVTIYSNTCMGQIRNINTTLALMSLLQSGETKIDIIEQKFLMPGHSSLPNNSDFRSVEFASKGKDIYLPEHWYSIMKSWFRVCEMNREEFFSTSNLERNICKRTRNLNYGIVNWLNIRWIRIEKRIPYCMKYKETLQDFVEFEVLDFAPRTKKISENATKEMLYPNPRPVSIKKKSDMLDLLKFIPSEYHSYFNNLATVDVEDSSGPLPFEYDGNGDSNGMQ